MQGIMQHVLNIYLVMVLLCNGIGLSINDYY